MLKPNETVLLVIDVQGKLAQLMHEKERLFENLAKLIRGAKILEVPIICTEQNPDGLGPTIEQIATLIEGKRIPKFSFSCCGEGRFMAELDKLARKQVLLSGIETHVCVYQTASELTERGYDVHVVADAVSSRTEENRRIALQVIGDARIKLTSVEMALFEMLQVAKGERFKQILQIVK